MIYISKEIQDRLIEEAKEKSPREACGILAGRGNRVEKVYKMTNVSEKPELCYYMESREQLKTMKELRNSGWEMVGIYHSHPETEACPSPRDVELAFYPEAVYVIVSLKNKDAPEIGAFRIDGGKITGEEIAYGY
jgi:proteasome lid subunit RPN8/RPN11